MDDPSPRLCNVIVRMTMMVCCVDFVMLGFIHLMNNDDEYTNANPNMTPMIIPSNSLY